eukprot:gene11887-2441_t
MTLKFDRPRVMYTQAEQNDIRTLRTRTITQTRVLSAAGGLLKWPPFREAVLQMLENNIDSPYLLSFLVDCYEEQLEKEANEDSLKKAMELCDRLSTDADCIRRSYWDYVGRSLKCKYGAKA